jgi:ribosome-associated toxin RatA of RatAB toxin-antitoxin module
VPHSYVVTALSAAEPDAVFAALVRADTWPSWSPIDRVEVTDPERPQQVGDVRIFHTGRSASHERIVELVPARTFRYDIVEGMFRSYHGTVDLAPAPGGGTTITWSARFVPKMPLTGRFWSWYLTRFMRRMVEGLAAYAR